MNIFDLFAKISLDSEAFNKGVKQAEGQMINLSKGMSKMGNTFTSIGGATQKVGQGIESLGRKASVVTAAVSGIFTGAFAKAKSYIQTYESAMVVFKNSSNVGEEAANSLFKSIINVAQNSSFAREHLVEASKTLVAFGFDAQKTTTYVQTITNAVAKMGKSGSEIERMAELFGKMSSQTKIYSTDMNTMVNSGIKAWDILATHFHTTKEEIQDMAKKGELLANDTLQILTDALNETNESSEMFQYSVAGMAKALKSGTLTGVIDSLNSSFRTFSINLLGMDPASKKGQEGIKSLNATLSAFGKAVETIGIKFSFVGDWLRQGFDKATEAIKKFTTMLTGTPEEKIQGLTRSMMGFSSSLPGLSNEMEELSQNKFKRLAKAILGVAAAGPGLTGLGKAVQGIGKSFSGVGNVFKFIGGAGQGAISNIVNIGSNVSKVFGSVSNVVKSFGKVDLNNMFDMSKLQNNILSTMASINMRLAPMVDGIQNKFGGLAAKIGEPLKSIGGKFGQVFGNIQEKFGGIYEKIAGPIQKVGGVFGKVFGELGAKVGPALSQLGGTLFNFASSLVPKLIGGFNFAAIGGAVIAGMGLLQSNFGEKIDEFANMAMEKGPDLITNFVNGITSKLPELLEKGQQLLETLLNVITTNMPMILQGAAQIIITLAQGFSQNLPMILDSVLSILLMFENTITENLPMIIKIGMEVLSNLIKGIAKHTKDFIRAGIDLIFTLCDSLLDNLDELIDAGIELCIALADGLIDALPKLIEKAPILIEKLIDKIVDNLPKIIDAGITIIIKLAEGIVKEVPHLIEKLPGIIEKIVNGLGDLGWKLLDVGKHAIEELWNGISSMGGWIGDKIGGFCNEIGNGFKSFFGIQSPSKFFSDQIGKNLALGIGVGFGETIGGVERSMINGLSVGRIQSKLQSKLNSITGGLNYGSISVGDSYSALRSAGTLNAILSTNNGQKSDINVYIGGKKIATEIYDPFMDLMRNKEVRIGV